MPDLRISILLEYRRQKIFFYQVVSCCTAIHYLIYIQKILTLVNYNLNLKKGSRSVWTYHLWYHISWYLWYRYHSTDLASSSSLNSSPIYQAKCHSYLFPTKPNNSPIHHFFSNFNINSIFVNQYFKSLKNPNKN